MRININISTNTHTFTCMWVDGFGWENTIFEPSDFDKVVILPIKENESLIFYAYNFNGKNNRTEIRKFKGYKNNK